MTLVLDGSVATAWCFEDERTASLDALQDRVTADGAVVPSLWRIEVGNALLMAVRRRRMTTERRSAMLTALMAMAIREDTATSEQVWSATMALADLHDLTIYDATYLELALRRRLPLATLDRALGRAATAEGIATLP